MPWSLEIHHLDVGSSGDCTIIIARHPGAGGAAIERTVLIDAGKASQNPNTGIARAQNVHNYLVGLPIAHVDVIIATHYDDDHYSGLYYLLALPVPSIYDHAIVYDQGQPPLREAYYKRSPTRDHLGNITGYKDSTDYLQYLKALRNNTNVRRATLFTNSFQIVQYNGNHHAAYPPPALVPPPPAPLPAPLNIPIPNNWPAPPPAGWAPGADWLNTQYYGGNPLGGANDQRPVTGQAVLPPHWLLGREVMWGNGMDGQNGRAAFGPGPVAPPPNGPTLTCIAANKWTHQAGGPSFVSTLDIFNGPNRMSNAQINMYENGHPSPDDNTKSLGFILEFNNFRYYIAGDLPEAQEDGATNFRALPAVVFKNGVRQFLNPNNNIPGRVTIIKASHHGSDTSTSRQFVEHLRPCAAIISCSTANTFDHPAQRTINVLDGYAREPINMVAPAPHLLSSYQHPNRPPAPPYQPVTHYLTGYQDPTNPVFGARSFGGDASYTAGAPWNGPPDDGHIIVRVSEAQSQLPVVGQVYRGVRAAADTINTHLGMGLTAAQLDDIADKAATYGVYTAATLAAGAHINVGVAALESAAWVGRDDNDQSIIETANGAGGIPAAIVAINADWRVNGIPGLVQAIANAVNGQNVAAIVAAMGILGTANDRNVAGLAGHHIFQNLGGAPHGNIPAGFAVTAAISAINTPAPNTPTVSQAVVIAAAIALEVYLRLPGIPAMGPNAAIDVIYDTAIAAGMTPQRAAITAAVVIATISKGEANRVQLGVQQALIRQGVVLLTAQNQGNLALAAANNNAGVLFDVHFHRSTAGNQLGAALTINHRY